MCTQNTNWSSIYVNVLTYIYVYVFVSIPHTYVHACSLHSIFIEIVLKMN